MTDITLGKFNFEELCKSDCTAFDKMFNQYEKYYGKNGALIFANEAIGENDELLMSLYNIARCVGDQPTLKQTMDAGTLVLDALTAYMIERSGGES